MKKRRGLFLFLFIVALSHSVYAYYTPKQYIDKFSPIAMMLMHQYDIPASVILGVAFLESGFGNSKNAVLLRNHFGLVGKNNLRKEGVSYRSVYKGFENDTLSYLYFCKTISSKKYYLKLKGKIDYKIWLSKIHKNNYAKSKHLWIKRITLVIKKYHLFRFDVLK